MAPTPTTIKLLSILSKDRCAFPECNRPLSHYASRTVTGIICHIKAKNEGGSRYDPTQTDKERDSFDNLIMLCPSHHKVIDENPDVYTVEKLLEMKRKHDKRRDEIPQPSIRRELEIIKEMVYKHEEYIKKRNEENEE